MSSADENSPAATARFHDPMANKDREIASLRDQLAALQQSNVVEGKFAGEMPTYYLNDPGYYDDTLWPAGSTIGWWDTPNLTMVPQNDSAKRAMADYLEMLTSAGQRKAAMTGQFFPGIVNDRNILVDMAREAAKQHADSTAPIVPVPIRHDQVPTMPHTDEAIAAQRRRPGRPKKAVGVSNPAPVGSPTDMGAPMLAPKPTDHPGSGIVGRMVSGS